MTKNPPATRDVLIPMNGGAAISVMTALGATPTAVSLDIEYVDMPFADWENLGRQIGFISSAWQWWIGDWLNFGEMSYGEEAAQAVDDRPSRYDIAMRITGLEQSTLQNYRSICAKVAKPRRRRELNFAAHTAVASLEPEAQTEWLEKAVENQWGRDQILKERKAAKQKADGTDTDEDVTEEPETFYERVHKVLIAIVHTADKIDGGWIVADEQMARARAIVENE